MKQITLLCCLAAFIFTNSQAQNQAWAVTSDYTNHADEGFSVDIDIAGNRYVAGMYQDTLYVDGVAYPNYSNDGSVDGFVIKYNANGDVMWVQTINGASDQYIRCVKVNRATGEVYVSGIFYYSFYIDGALQNSYEYATFPGTYSRVFIAKFNSDGTFAWSNNTRSLAEYGTDGGYSLALDPSGSSIYLQASFIADIQFQDGIPLEESGFGASGILLARLAASNGSVMDANTEIGGYLFYGKILATDKLGNLYYAGYHALTCLSDEIPAFAPCTTNPGVTQAFIYKMDANFNGIWGKETSGNGFDEIHAMSIDDNNNVYIYGVYTEPTTFGAITLDTVGGWDNAFVAKLTSSGSFSYVKQLAAQNLQIIEFPSDYEAPFAVDKKGNAYLGGGFTGTLNMQNASLTTEAYPSDFYQNGYIIKLNNKGKVRWAQKYTGNTGPFDPTRVKGIAVNGSNLAVGGRMINYNAYMGDTITSDYYAFFLSALQDCDVAISIIATNDSANVLNPVTLSTPLKPGYTYQWQRNNVNIAGATANSYIATVGGNYRCIVTTGACTLTSNKIKLYPHVRLGDVITEEIGLYPNPTHDAFTITLPALYSGKTISLTISDITGKIHDAREMLVDENGDVHVTIDKNIPAGTYLVSILSGDLNTTLPVIIE